MNKYESNILANTLIMKIMYVLLLIVNMLLPYHKGWNWTFSIFQFAIVVIWFFGLLGGLGYFNQATPILPLGITRIVQLGSYCLFKFHKINWGIIGIFILMDVIFLLFLLFDKANYKYEIIEVEKDGDGN